MNDLKTNNKQTRQRGTTLIELSVVIAVLLLLVGVLFIGITAWKNGANTAACVVNLSSIQKAARGYANMNGARRRRPALPLILSVPDIFCHNAKMSIRSCLHYVWPWSRPME